MKRLAGLFLVMCAVVFGQFGSAEMDVTTAATAEQLSSTSIIVTSFSVCAKSANTGYVYVGGADVDSTNTKRMSSGECVAFLPQDSQPRYNLLHLYVDVSVNGEGVTYTWTI